MASRTVDLVPMVASPGGPIIAPLARHVRQEIAATAGDGRITAMLDFLPLTLPALAENLALDEALLLDAEGGAAGEVLRLWQWTGRAVVLGAGGIMDDDVVASACEADGVPLARRASGGGTVLLG